MVGWPRMPKETDRALVSVEPCGCASLVHIMPEDVRPGDDTMRHIAECEKRGGCLQWTTVGEARVWPFIGIDCPHAAPTGASTGAVA